MCAGVDDAPRLMVDECVRAEAVSPPAEAELQHEHARQLQYVAQRLAGREGHAGDGGIVAGVEVNGGVFGRRKFLNFEEFHLAVSGQAIASIRFR